MEWYRKTSWSENDKNEFFEKLKRARDYNKAQYLLIQAGTLVSTKNPNLLDVAEGLLNKILKEFPNEKGEKSPTLNSLGNIYKIRENYEEAIKYYKKSLEFEEVFPYRITNSYLDYSELIVKTKNYEAYNYAEKILEKEIPESLFPVTKYKGFSILAIINYHKGNLKKAKIYENLAEENANAKTTDLRYHKFLGIVKKRNCWLDKLIKK